VLLRVFVKKTKKTPRQEIRIAKNRLDEHAGRFK
jgi:phage-related protein